MGQYFKAVSLDAKEKVSPFGAKLMEHSWLPNPYMKQVERLLSPGNNWYKTRIVWAGDYMQERLFVDKETTLYEECREWPEASSEVDGPEIIYVVNHTKNMYIDLREVPDCGDKHEQGWKEGWKIHPLSILTSSGNGRGGGDYKDDYDENVGYWAGDVISTEYEEPIDMEKYIAFFIVD